MTGKNHSRQLARQGAQLIQESYNTYTASFKEITRRAKGRFEQRDWAGVQRDMVERLELYTGVVSQTAARMQTIFAAGVKDKSLWANMKKHYSGLVAHRSDLELAETFFNSVTRRIFVTVGVDPNIEYVASDFKMPALVSGEPVYKTYAGYNSLEAFTQAILADYPFQCLYRDLALDTRRVAASIEAHLQTLKPAYPIEAIDMLKSVFYRNKGAYIIGRIRAGATIIPLLLALVNPPEGITIDAVLLAEDEASIVFSFTRAYFQVEVEKPYELINFLASIMPLKPVAELYISIGFNKHGKTELYRDLLRHIEQSADKFEVARGARGMVMAVFTLPSYDMVFKIIKDTFDYPKKTTRRRVMERYQLVFRHDRAGRLIDAQEFEYLTFDRARFSPELLAELQTVAANSVTITGHTVSIKHLYIERRLTPLDIYVQEASGALAGQAIIDCGLAIKDLAATNIFPGDFLLKNFGVTRHGRVVFYDYDELTLLTECNFRQMPPPRSDFEEFEAQPWFFVADNDIFPEEFTIFLGLPTSLKSIFNRAHADIFGVDFWQQMQQKHNNGEAIDIFPYKQERRLH